MKSIFCVFIIHHIITEIITDEFSCVLNGKKSVNYVSDKFLSFTIDPAILLSGLNIGASTMQLVKQLSPAYIRIAGPSTKYLHFDELDTIHPSKVSTLKFTSSMWKDLNKWFYESNLVPVFAVGGKNTAGHMLNLRTLLPLLELSNELNLRCFWQIDYETGRKNLAQYRDELEFLQHVLNTFPNSKVNWKIVGGDMSHWFESESLQTIKSSLGGIINITEAIMWQMKDNYIPEISTNLSMWLQIPKSQQPVTFNSAILWARIIGDAALAGYDAIFREPRLFEIITETPVFWVTLLFKKLMGRNVFEIKPNKFGNGEISIYCHCSRTQNDFSRRGAVTILGINNNEVDQTLYLKISSVTPRNTEVQSYILTSDFENSTITYMNAVELNMAKILNHTLLLEPKLRRARSQKHLVLNLPLKSIGFFVVPDARVPICISNEDDTNLLLKQMHEAQSISFVHEAFPEVASRLKESAPTLKDLYLMMERELENDEKYYCNVAKSANYTSENWKNALLQNYKEISPAHMLSENATSQISRILLLAEIKRRKEDVEKRKSELVQKKKSKPIKTMFNKTSDICYIDDIHTDIKPETREAKGHGRGRGGSHGRGKPKITYTPLPRRDEQIKNPKRDINMRLLEEKTKEIDRGIEIRYRPDDYPHIVQPENAYKDLDTTKRATLDLVKVSDTSFQNFDKMNIDEEYWKTRRNENLDSGVYDTTKAFELDEVEYSDIFDDLRASSRGLDVSSINEDINDFPIRSTFRVENKYLNFNNGPINTNGGYEEGMVIENEEDLEEALRELESYFIQNKRDSSDLHISFLDYYDDYDISTPMRSKRESDSEGYTEDDIRNYRLLMSSNKRHMRENMAKQKLKNLWNANDVKLQSLTPRLKQKQPIEKNLAQLRVLPLQERQKTNLGRYEGIRMRNGFRLLKSGLAKQKAKEGDFQQPLKEETQPVKLSARAEDIDEETKQLIQTIKADLRNKRLRSARRIRRRIGTNSVENGIQGTVNALTEDANYLIPKIDDTKISLTLPNKDEILLSNDVNGVGIQYLHSKPATESKSDVSATHQSPSSMTDILPRGTTEIQDLITEFGSNHQEDRGKSDKHVTHIQKIRKSREDTIFEKIIKGVSDFVGNVTDKISSCFIFCD